MDFRLICATHRDLAKEIDRGNFRQDFYYRLNVIEIEVPLLRDAGWGYPRCWLNISWSGSEARPTSRSWASNRRAWHLLESYDWPGNVRELENAVERAVVLAKGSTLSRDDFAFLFRSAGQVLPQSLKENEKQHIERILKLCKETSQGQRTFSKSAAITLHSKLKRYGPQSSDPQQNSR